MSLPTEHPGTRDVEASGGPSTARSGQEPKNRSKASVLAALPVFNEEKHLDQVLNEVRRYCDDVLVVDDGSTDKTPLILAQHEGVHVLCHATNKGYGDALQTAFNFAIQDQFDILVTIDCDGQHEPRLIPEIAAQVFPEDGPAVDIVSGSRYLQVFPGQQPPPEERRRINQTITQLLNERLDFNLTDAFCGFKAYRVLSLERLNITDPGYAMPLQLWVQAHALGFRIVEFPVPLVYLEEERSFGGSLDDSEERLKYYLHVLDEEFAAVGQASEGRSEST